jgi:hypothetical protein
MRARSASAVLVLLVLASTVAGCGQADRNERAPARTPLPMPSRSDRPATGDNLMLYVSNQSYRDDPVHLQVTIDSVRVVDRGFDVGSQHSWVSFPMTLPPGTHQVRAVSDTGVELVESLSIPDTGTRYASLSYWFYPEQPPRRFTLDVSDTPFAFG